MTIRSLLAPPEKRVAGASSRNSPDRRAIRANRLHCPGDRYGDAWPGGCRSKAIRTEPLRVSTCPSGIIASASTTFQRFLAVFRSPCNGSRRGELQPLQRSLAGTERRDLQAESLKHGHIEVAQGSVVFSIKGQVLAVLEAAARQEDGQVGGFVRVGIAQVAAEQDHRAVEQRLAFFLRTR